MCEIARCKISLVDEVRIQIAEIEKRVRGQKVEARKADIFL